MPKETNQNKIPKKNKASAPTDSSSPESQASSKDVGGAAPKVPSGALAKALMRTFRGDISESLGPKASRKQVDQLLPKKLPPDPIDAATKIKEPPKKKNEAVVHTFKDDVQNLVRNRKMSLARIAALESDRGERSISNTGEHEPWKTTVVVALTALFLIIGAVLALGAYYAYQLNVVPNTDPQFEPSIIFTEARENIDVTDKKARNIMTTLGNTRRGVFFSLGSVVELYLTRLVDVPEGQSVQRRLGSAVFLEAIEADVPETFLQTLGSDYVLGIHVIDENIPYLILTSKSYGHTFAGMLQWERNIEENLTPFFSPGVQFVKPAIAEGENMFSDTVIENLDVRILRDSNGDIRILYAFVNRKSVVITTDIRTLIELARRLRVAEI